MKAAVIGAGAAGLAATSALVKAGVEVTTFEACGEAGGRARCYRKDGFTLDTGAQFMAKVCKTQIRLCHELRLGDQIMPFALVGLYEGFLLMDSGALSPALRTSRSSRMLSGGMKQSVSSRPGSSRRCTA